MKKFLTLGIAALVLITLSGCQFNIFAAFDKLDIPSAAELSNQAATDPDGFVSDVEDYVENDFLENEDVTDAQIDAIITGLETVYGAAGATETGQQAAVLAGEIIINSDPDTSSVVNGIIGAISTALGAGGTIDIDTLVGDIFPSNLDLAGLTNILDVLDQAALAYDNFSTTVSGGGTADWMSSGEVGDVVQLAVVALLVADIRDQVNDADILAAINNDTPLVGVTNPLDTNDGIPSMYEDALLDMLTFAGLDIGL